MIKNILFGLCILLLLPFVSASDGGIKFENTTVIADIFNGTMYFNATAANITIQDQLGQTIVENDAMTLDVNQTGVFRYFFIPQSSGNYYIKVQYFTGTIFLIERGQSLEIRISEDEKMLPVAAILFFAILICLFGVGALWAFKNENTEIFYTGFLFLGGILFVINIAAFLIMELATSQSYFTVMRTVFVITSVLSTLYLFVGMLPVIILMFWKFFTKMIFGDKA